MAPSQHWGATSTLTMYAATVKASYRSASIIMNLFVLHHLHLSHRMLVHSK